MRLKMCSIHVKDPASAHEFYTGTLGFETLMAMPEHNLFIIKDADGAGGAGLLLEPSDKPSEGPGGTSVVLDDGCGNFVQLHQD